MAAAVPAAASTLGSLAAAAAAAVAAGSAAASLTPTIAVVPLVALRPWSAQHRCLPGHVAADACGDAIATLAATTLVALAAELPRSGEGSGDAVASIGICGVRAEIAVGARLLARACIAYLSAFQRMQARGKHDSAIL